MTVRDFNRIVEATPRVLPDGQWTLVRMLLDGDGMGFSFHVACLDAGSEHRFEYKTDFESLNCMKGTGAIIQASPSSPAVSRPSPAPGLEAIGARRGPATATGSSSSNAMC